MKRRLLSALLAAALLLPLFPAAARAAAYTGRTVTFGSYPQTEAEATPALEGAAWDADGDASVGGARYRRLETEDGWRYFRYEPVVWQVIARGTNLTLLARGVLDAAAYDSQEQRFRDLGGTELEYCLSTSWSAASVRAWLCGETRSAGQTTWEGPAFVSAAFSAAERAALVSSAGGPAALLSLAEARAMAGSGSAVLRKRPSDYARARGAAAAAGGCADWLLRDVSPVNAACACSVDADGAVDAEADRLVNAVCGIAPCVTVPAAAIPASAWGTDDAGAKTIIYAPWGEAAEVGTAEAAAWLRQGWYTTAAAAAAALPARLNSRFRASAAAVSYQGDVTAWADAAAPRLSLCCGTRNIGPAGAVAYLRGLADAFRTGRQRDYAAFSVAFDFAAADESAFNAQAERVAAAVQTCWSFWGIEISAQTATGQTGPGVWRLTVRLEINGRCTYGLYEARYFAALRALAADARRYSDRPLAQIAYLRAWLAQRAAYDLSSATNSPAPILLGGAGVCGSYANAVRELCDLLDIPCFTVTSTSEDHAWNCLYLEGAWYELDTTGISGGGFTAGGRRCEAPPAPFDAAVRADEVSFLKASAYGTRTGDTVGAADFAALTALCAVRTAFPAAEPLFADVPADAWYGPAVRWAVDKSIIRGASPVLFAPGGACTRGQIVTMLWRAAGSPACSGTAPVFTDVRPGDYDYEAVCWAAEQKITAGTSATAFSPAQACTRGEAVTFLWRAAGSPACSGTAPAFADVRPGDYDYEAVCWAAEQKITGGTAASAFSPAQTCTRCQIVAFLYRAG